MSDAAAVLRGIFNDYQIEIAGPDVDRGIAAVRNLEEQLETALARAEAAEAFIVQMDMSYRYEEFRERHASSPANSPHEHTWSLPENSGVYRCMTCGVETTDLGAPLPASDPFDAGGQVHDPARGPILNPKSATLRAHDPQWESSPASEPSSGSAASTEDDLPSAATKRADLAEPTPASFQERTPE